MTTVYDIFLKVEQQSKNHPKKLLFKGDKDLSFHEAFYFFHKMAVFYEQNSLHKTDVVIVSTKDPLYCSLMVLGTLYSGVCLLPVHTETPKDHIKKMVSQVKASMAFLDKDLYKKFKGLGVKCYFLDDLLSNKSLLRSPILGPPFLKKKLQKIKKNHLIKAKDFSKKRHSQIKKDDHLWILMSSGTTGFSKLSPISQDNLLTQLQVLSQFFGFNEHTICYTDFPVTHIDGCLTAVLNTFFAFGTSAVKNHSLRGNLKKLSPIEALEKTKATVFLTTPSAINLLLFFEKSLKERFEKLTCLEKIILTSSYLQPENWKAFQKHVKKSVYNTYGMTEIGTLVSYATEKLAKQHHYDTIGPLLIGEGKVVDKDFHEVKKGEKGELMYCGPTVISDYLGEETVPFVEKDGKKWFLTGDYVREHHDGALQFLERKKQIIIVLGKTFLPQELEACLMKHPHILEACALGVHHKIFGEKLAFAIVLRPGKHLTKAEVSQYLQKEYELENSFIEFFPSLPKGPSHKMLRNQVKEMFYGRLESLKKT